MNCLDVHGLAIFLRNLKSGYDENFVRNQYQSERVSNRNPQRNDISYASGIEYSLKKAFEVFIFIVLQPAEEYLLLRAKALNVN